MTRCPKCDHFNLVDAAVCERCGASLQAAAAGPSPTAEGSLDAQVLTIAGTGGKIAAIKWYREQTGKDLKSSKDFVEELMRRHNVSAPKSGCAGIVLMIVATSAALAALAGA
ncbi:MAG: hypothetical protein U0992_19860 [Planctomycetaceae bacterium]